MPCGKNDLFAYSKMKISSFQGLDLFDVCNRKLMVTETTSSIQRRLEMVLMDILGSYD